MNRRGFLTHTLAALIAPTLPALAFDDVKSWTGTWVDKLVCVDGEVISTSLQDEGNGWHRVSVTYRTPKNTAGDIVLDFGHINGGKGLRVNCNDGDRLTGNVETGIFTFSMFVKPQDAAAFQPVLMSH